MNETTAKVIEATLTVFFIIGIGVFLRRIGVFKKESDSTILALVVNVLLPCLIFSKIIQNEKLTDLSTIIIPPLYGFFMVVIGYGISYCVARYFGKYFDLDSNLKHRTFASSTGLQNYGFILIPMIGILYSHTKSLNILGFLFLHNIGVELAIWSVGVLLITGEFNKRSWKKLINIPTITIIISVIILLSGKKDSFSSGSLFNAINILGGACVPLSILFVGASISDQFNGKKIHIKSWCKIGVLCIVLRQCLFPILMIGSLQIFTVHEDLKQIIFLQAAMPAALFPIVLAKIFNGCSETAIKTAMLSTLTSLLTIPFWVKFGPELFN